MSVLLESTVGDIVVDLNVKKYEIESYNFLKLCKCQFFQNQCFYNLHNSQYIQFGDALLGYEDRKELRLHNTSIEGIAKMQESFVKARLVRATERPEPLSPVHKGDFGNLIVDKPGVDEPLIGSQMVLSLNESNTRTPNAIYFGRVTKNCWSVLDKMSTLAVDNRLRPLEDIRLRGVYILHDPFPDGPNLCVYQVSLPTLDVRLPQVLLDDLQSEAPEIKEDIRRKELSLEIIGDIPFVGIKPSPKVLFICKLNPLTKARDLATVFQRFGEVLSVEIVRDKTTGKSLGYGFIEFADRRCCEHAYKKMEGTIIDDRRIYVDFSQSVKAAAKSLKK